MSQTTQKEFGKWRSLLWPVHNFELKKLLPMFLLFFFISFNYTILRDTKDTLIVTAAGSGAEAIPFLKVWGVLPMAIIFMIIYSKLSNKLSKPALFYSTITPFLVFFALFALVIYPLKDSLHPNALCDRLQTILPSGFMGMIAMFRNWTFSLFYIMSELWGSVALSLLFWGFANDIMKVTEAKRFYAVLGLGANLALLVSGPCIMAAANIRSKLPPNVDAWGVTLNYLIGMVIIAGILIILIYRWINKNVLTDKRFYSQTEIKKSKKTKPKMSLKESFLYLTRSKYMGLLAILVIAYGISINIVEVTWKSQLKLQYSNPNDYAVFMGGFSMITGLITCFMMLFVGGNVIRNFGWKTAALITPIVLLITGMIFFSCVLFKKPLGPIIGAIGTTPLMIAVVVGAAQNIMSKASKYSLFDPTKEMAYIPLDQESKVKGKAAIDVVGARLGKSGGSLLQQGLIIALGSALAMTPYVAAILLGIILLWITSAKSLSKLFQKKVEEMPSSDDSGGDKATATKSATKEKFSQKAPSAN
jgi:ATP:ADP antiporter, AAA family